MDVRDIFGLVVRLAGLTMILFGVFDLIHVLMDAIGLPMGQEHSIGVAVAGSIIWAVLGMGTMLSANLLTRLAYRSHD